MILLSCSVVLLSSCDKEDDSNTSGTPSNSSGSESINISFQNGNFMPAEGNGLLVLANSVSHSVNPSGQTEVSSYESGSLAIFYSNPAAGSTLDAGVVLINADTLINFFNNYVSFNTDNYFYKGVNWKVSGNSNSGVSALNYSMSSDTPHFNLWNANPVYTKSNGVSLAFNGAFTKADTLIVSVVNAANDEIEFSKPLSPKATGIDFSSSELVDIPTGQVYIKVRAINFNSKTFSGKKYYFATEFSRIANAELN